MEQPLSRLATFDFVERRRVQEIAELRYRELLKYEHAMPPAHASVTVFLCDRDPIQWMAGFIAACSVPCELFLCNPDWGETEWKQVFELAQPTLIWGEPRFVEGLENRPLNPPKLGDFECREFPDFKVPQNEGFRVLKPTEAQHEALLIMIPTGGTSGKIRFAIHTWDTLTASVQGFRQYFELDRINSFCVLPLYHVSGLMQLLRSLLTNGTFTLQSWKNLNTDFDPQNFFISLVPTQLQQLMPHADWLAKFRTILLGGAPAWSNLLEDARLKHLPIAPTYGMTETASQIATLKPADFLKGVQGCGQVLPHAEITIAHQKLLIRSKSLMLGYYPNLDQPETFEPDDLGYFDEQNYLHLIGRDSNKIISGGENIFPAEVESAIRSTNLVRDIHVLGIPDEIWGQSVTAIYVPDDETVTFEEIKTALKSHLTSFKIPKRWIAVAQIPRSLQGKIQRHRIEAILDLHKRSDS
ncbi:2-succinylbenzoate--CoA ligase [Leptolyngbya sp. GGD]|uniref:2-succinylbenzoate--CoA ligase n=1 Tax=Leptolyngbya sp. GGD TaxID=2997907 RepID=UPI00227A8760|nr:2-succinylbenzoate--CoA ligase [Leptolyngbya sp. GGD]MCY6491155.1 2-succinylbenzoate--CoA ligase [Leptolyngbya sp. GGD]